jgi:hypothetical protein
MFTPVMLRVIWCAYLAGALFNLILVWSLTISAASTFPPGGGVNVKYLVSLIPTTVFELAKLGLVRLFLEMAAQFIAQRRAE